MDLNKEKIRAFGKIKKEYEDFKRIREDLGLGESQLIDLEKMKENLKESKLKNIKQIAEELQIKKTC